MSDKPEAMTPQIPVRLWQSPTADEYPEPDPSDRRLVGSNDICYGILFGMLPEVKDAQEYLVLAVNSHARLLKEREELRAALAALVKVADTRWHKVGPDMDRARSALKDKD